VLATQNPVDGFRGQAVKCGDRKLEVVFAGILKLVMADTAETLHEHHNRRNASAGDFGGIVEGAPRALGTKCGKPHKRLAHTAREDRGER
jgi:hypothetical protein